MGNVKTLRVDMTGEIQIGDVTLPLNLVGEMELSGGAHGSLELLGEQQAFLRVDGVDYVAEPGEAFEEDLFNDSSANILDILRPLVEPGADELFTDLERHADETLPEGNFYHITILMDMRAFIEGLAGEPLRGVKIRGHGELFIDQESLLPRRFTASCESCFIPFGDDADLTLDFTLSGYNEPISIPSPGDEPALLFAVEPDDHGNEPSTATQLALGEEATGGIDSFGDADYFSFKAEAGQAYAITVDLGALFDSELTLYDTDGETELAYNDDYGDTAGSRIVWVAPTTGAYYVEVIGFGFDETGSYTISLAAWSGPVPTPVAIRTPIVEREVERRSEAGSERDAIQSAMDAMLAETLAGGVNPTGPIAANDWTANPTGNSQVRVLNPAYLRNATSTYYYCWESDGLITIQSESPITCPPAPAPAAPAPTAEPTLLLKGSVIAHESSTGDVIGRIQIPIGAALGEPVDLSAASVLVTYIDADQIMQLSQNNSAEVAGNYPGWDIEFRAGDSGPVLDPGERADFWVNLHGLTIQLGPSTHFSIQIKPAVGAILEITRTTPGEITTIVNLN